MLLIHTAGSFLCWGKFPCHLGVDHKLWEPLVHVLLLQTWMSSTQACLCSSGSQSGGECRTRIALLKWWGKTKSTPCLVTHRCKDGERIGSIGCLGRKVRSELSTAIIDLGGSGDKGKDFKGTHGTASAACSDLPGEEWSPPHALVFCQPAPLSLLHTHTHFSTVCKGVWESILQLCCK